MWENTILVVVDSAAGSHQPALERAAWLAKQAGARLELFACEYDPDIDCRAASTPSARERCSQAAARNLEDLAAPLRQQGLRVSVDVVWDHPFDAAIIKKAAAHDYWLVAKDTHHHNFSQRTLLTNVDWLLIRKCPAPLLLVKDRKLAAEPNVLAAVDPLNEHDKPAALDERIYTFSAELARTLRGHLHVVHSYGTPLGAELPLDAVKLIADEHRAAHETVSRHARGARRPPAPLRGAGARVLAEGGEGARGRLRRHGRRGAPRLEAACSSAARRSACSTGCRAISSSSSHSSSTRRRRLICAGQERWCSSNDEHLALRGCEVSAARRVRLARPYAAPRRLCAQRRRPPLDALKIGGQPIDHALERLHSRGQRSSVWPASSPVRDRCNRTAYRATPGRTRARSRAPRRVGAR